ncbi:MAG TPA: hypothetical protein VGF60_06085 [Xanthobacteraceae bacterium]
MSSKLRWSGHEGTRVLREDELDAVNGGVEGYPGLPPGSVINISPFGGTFDLQWVLVGATGHLPR